MTKADITLRITRLSMPDLYQLGSNVEAGLRNNPIFPEPRIPLEQLRSLLNDFKDLIVAAGDGGKEAYIARDACAGQLRTALEILATYVRMESAGEAVKLLSSGFPLRKTPTPIGTPLPCAGIQARRGEQQGTIKLRWKPSKGAKYYNVFIAPLGGEEGYRMLRTTTRCSFLVEDLVTGSRHCLMVTPTGVAGTGLKSAVAIGMAA